MRLLVLFIVSLQLAAFAGKKCPLIDTQNIKAEWEAANADELRYFYLDLASLNKGVLAVGFWNDTAIVSLFSLTSYQINKGSLMLLFESLERNSSDKVVISGKGRACGTSGSIEADVQLVFKHTVLSRNLSIVFRKMTTEENSMLTLLRKVATPCIEKVKINKGK
jgi:hypothetical protein